MFRHKIDVHRLHYQVIMIQIQHTIVIFHELIICIYTTASIHFLPLSFIL